MNHSLFKTIPSALRVCCKCACCLMSLIFLVIKRIWKNIPQDRTLPWEVSKVVCIKLSNLIEDFPNPNLYLTFALRTFCNYKPLGSWGKRKREKKFSESFMFVANFLLKWDELNLAFFTVISINNLCRKVCISFSALMWATVWSFSPYSQCPSFHQCSLALFLVFLTFSDTFLEAL